MTAEDGRTCPVVGYVLDLDDDGLTATLESRLISMGHEPNGEKKKGDGLGMLSIGGLFRRVSQLGAVYMCCSPANKTYNRHRSSGRRLSAVPYHDGAWIGFGLRLDVC